MREVFKDLSDLDYEKLVNSMYVGPHDCFEKLKPLQKHIPGAQESQKDRA